MRFNDMNIEKNVLDSLNQMGFNEPTEIQKETIPLIKEGHDLIGQSKTGSGKTAAFGIPLVEKVKNTGKIQALILEPTRELAEQTSNELRKFSKFKRLHVLCVYGGVSIEHQISNLKHSDIIVGTPGRTLDHIQRGTMNLQNVNIFVLDETDKMFEMGFIEDIERIIKFLPDDRQNLFFSATMPDEVLRIKNKFTRNAKKVKTETMLSEDVLEQFYYDVYPTEKFSLLVQLLKNENPDLSIIFCNTRREAGCVAENLKRNSIIASCLHGGLTQARRNQVIQDFHSKKIKVLVATDVAGRGLDIKNVSHIFNYNIPKCPEDYINRIGRTARIGETGKAISLLSNNDHDCFRRLINIYGPEIKRLDKPDFEILPFRKNFISARRPFYRPDFRHGFRRNEFKQRYSRCR